MGRKKRKSRPKLYNTIKPRTVMESPCIGFDGTGSGETPFFCIAIGTMYREDITPISYGLSKKRQKIPSTSKTLTEKVLSIVDNRDMKYVLIEKKDSNKIKSIVHPEIFSIPLLINSLGYGDNINLYLDGCFCLKHRNYIRDSLLQNFSISKNQIIFNVRGDKKYPIMNTAHKVAYLLHKFYKSYHHIPDRLEQNSVKFDLDHIVLK